MIEIAAPRRTARAMSATVIIKPPCVRPLRFSLPESIRTAIVGAESHRPA